MGSAGTIYLKDNAMADGVLIIDNGNASSSFYSRFMSTHSSLEALTLRNRGRLRLDSADVATLAVAQAIPVTGASVLVLSDGVSLVVNNTIGFDLSVESSSTLTTETGSTLGADELRISGGTTNTYIDLNFPAGNELEVSSGGRLNIMSGATLGVGFFTPDNIQNGTIDLRSGGAIAVASNELTIGSGVTLIKDGVFGDLDQVSAMTILNGGVVTHSPRYEPGLVLSVSGALDIQSGSLIDLNEKGLRGGNTGIFGDDGEAYDPSGVIVRGAVGGSASAGASYGGAGGTGNHGEATNPEYGILEDPHYLGSGGGGVTGGSAGGNGGGLVTITAGSVQLGGMIRANGGNGLYSSGPNSGAGSGGSVLIHTGTLSGDGLIQAIGGNGVNANSNASGSGGGGRIAVYYDGMTLADTRLLARGGNTSRMGSAGTIYLKDNAMADGVLIIDNSTVNTTLHTQLLTDLALSFDIRIANSEILEAAAGTVFTGGTILLQSSTLYSPGTITFQNNTLAGTGTVSASLINGGIIDPGALAPPGSIGTITVTGNLTFDPLGQYFCDINSTTVNDQLDVGGALDLDGAVEIRAGPSYVPDPADQIVVAHSSLLSDEFATYTFPTEAGGIAYTPTDALFVVFDYFIDIAVKDDVRNRAAVDGSATDAFDAGMDLLDNDADALVWFDHPDWGDPDDSRFQRDVREDYDITTAVKSWPFVVDYQNSSAESELIEVVFTPSFTEAAGIGLILRDRTTGQTVNLFPSLIYSFYAPPYNREVREFDLYVGQYGWTADDTDADGVLDVVDACLGGGPAYLDQDGDGCTDPVACARHIEYWRPIDMPLHYVIHADGAPGITDGSDLAALQAGFAAWTAVPDAAVSITYGGTTTQSDAQAMDMVNLVTFDDPDWPFGAGVLAVGLSTSFTIPMWDGDSATRPGQIIDADMIFNPAMTFSTPSMGSGPDIQSIATHEAGHMLGLSHSSVVTSTMFYVLPPAQDASVLALEDELAMLRSYPEPGILPGVSHLQGTVTSGWDGHAIGGAIVFAIATASGDTLGCDYTLPDAGSYHFIGLPDGDYWVAIHPLDGSSAIGYIGPANINELIRDRAEILFPPEYYDADESSTDDSEVRTAVSVAAGGVTVANLITNIDNLGPRVTAITPDRDSGDVPVDTTVLVEFSEPIDPNSLRGHFNLSLAPGGALIPGTPSLVGGSTLTYSPDPNLAFDTTYYLTLGPDITDQYGNPLTTPPDSLQSTFTTQARPAVSLDSLVPREGNTGTVVVISGQGFDAAPAANDIQLGSSTLPASQASVTELVVTIPDGLPLGTHQLTVTTGGLTSNPLNFDILELDAVPRGLGLATADLSGEARALDVAPAGGVVFVATDAGLAAVDVGEAGSPSVTSLAVDGGLDALAVTPVGNTVYAVNRQHRRLYRFQSEPLLLLSEAALADEPLAVVIGPSGNRAYLSTSTGAVQIWDVQPGSLTFAQQVGTVVVPGGNLVGPLATDPSGDRLLVLQGTGQLRVLATDDFSELAEVALGPAPRDVLVDPTGQRAYITHLDGLVSEVSLDSYTSLGAIPTGGSLLGADIKPTGSFVYAANVQLDNLDVIDLRPDSPTYRTVAGRVPHSGTPIDLAFSPDGQFAYSLAADDHVLVITATGEGPLLAQMTPPAGPVGAQVVLSGSGFTGGSVRFGDVDASIVAAGEASLTVVVPAGATSGPVVVRGDEPTEVSNAVEFAVLTPTTGELRFASAVEPAGAPALAAALATSPRGDIAAMGAQDGRVFLLDIAPQSQTFNQFVAVDATSVTAITDLAMAPDGDVVWTAATGDPQLRAVATDRSSSGFGTVVRTIDLGSADPQQLAVTPSGRDLLAGDPAAARVHVVDLATAAVSTVPLADALPGLNGQVRALAIHPAGVHAYLAIGDDDPAVVLVLDLPTRSIVGSVPLPAGAPAEVPVALDFAPDGHACYVLTSQETGTAHRTVVALNTADVVAPEVADTTPLATTGLPMAEVLRVSPAGGRLLLNIRDDGFYSLDLPTMTATEQPTAIAAGAPLDFSFSPDGSRIYAVSSDDGRFYSFDFLAEQRLVKVWGDGQAGVIDEPLSTPLRVRVVDIAGGEGSAGVPVTFAITTGGGGLAFADDSPTATSLTAGTDQYGYAQVIWTLGSVLGEQQVDVTAAGAAGSPMAYLATAVEDAQDQPLQVIAELLSPADLDAEVSVTSSIVAVFNRALDLDSVNDQTLYLVDQSTTDRIPAVIGLAYGDRQASLMPRAPLSSASSYDLLVTDVVLATDGSPLQNPTQISFTTAAPPPSPVLHHLSRPGAQITTEIVIAGMGFATTPAANLVTFDAASASVLEARVDRLRVRVPLGATSGPVTVEVDGQASNSVPFTVLLPPPPPVDHVVQRIETGTPTRTAVVSPDGTVLYALAPLADLIKPINLQTFQPLPGIPVGDQPRSLRVHPDGTYLYVVNEVSGDLSVVDIAAGSPTYNAVTATVKVGTAPFDLEITPDGDRVIVVNPGSSDVSVIDTDPSSSNFNQVISRVETGTASRTVAITPDGTRIYVGTQTGYLILDAVDYGVIRNVAAGTAARAVEVSPDGTLLIVVDTQGELRVFDIIPGSGREDQVVAQPTNATAVRTASVSPDGTLLFVSQENSNRVLVFALAVDASVGVRDGQQALAPTALVQVAELVGGQDPEDIIIDPLDPGRFFVTSASENAIDLFEAPQAPPPPLDNLAAQPLITANPGGFTFPLRVSWPAPDPGITVQLYRKGFGNYPEYDDEPAAGSVPTVPTSPAEAEAAGWALVTASQSASHDDLVTARDSWYYVAFSSGPGSLTSGPSPLTTGTLNYLLGDVSDGIAPGTGDNLVDGPDISALGSAYGTAAADTAYRPWLDVGPTVEYSPTGRPLTDNLVEFEDLILFAINYTLTGRLLPPPEPASTNLVTLDVPALPEVGEAFTATVRLQGNGTLQGMSVPVTWQSGALELLQWSAGDLLAAQGGPTMLLSPRPGVLDVALAGLRERGLSGSGDLAQLRFRVLSTANPHLKLEKVKARTQTNESVAIRSETVRAPDLPTVFALDQAYPNPFNPTTRIRFDIPRPTRAQLVVYDVAGREVATLVDEEKTPGSYTVVWQGQDGRGRTVASGVYFYRLVAGDFEMTRKMLLLK
jgi:YVTN family beta-propeller protein